MKKRIVISMAILFCLMLIPVQAWARTYEVTLPLGESYELSWSREKYVSDNPNVIRVFQDGEYEWHVEAVGIGTANVTGGEWAGVPKNYTITVERAPLIKLDLATWAKLIIFVSVGLSVAICVFILIDAPKHGMSRAWVFVPVVGSWFGFVLYLLVRLHRRDTQANLVVCKNCSSTHPAGTRFCSHCGNKIE